MNETTLRVPVLWGKKGAILRGEGMVSRRSSRLLASFTLLFAVVLSASAPTLASAKSRPKVIVTPSHSLRAGQTVKVAGHGFTPGDGVYIVECMASATDSTGCDIATAIPATITAKGALAPTKFKIVTGVVGNGTCGTTKANLKQCAISVGNVTGGDSGVARITFAPLKAKK